jgi:GNAT superfamily N-acetyltransferase
MANWCQRLSASHWPAYRGTMPFTISTLQDHPYFAGIIADRCWHAWWQDSDYSLGEYRGWLDECLEGREIPACFVAHHGETYLGSTCLIANDLEARPHYTPWIAALWVEESHRRGGIATALMNRAATTAAALGFSKAYLCAVPEKTAFYVKRGLVVLEEDVEGLTVFVAGV